VSRAIRAHIYAQSNSRGKITRKKITEAAEVITIDTTGEIIKTDIISQAVKNVTNARYSHIYISADRDREAEAVEGAVDVTAAIEAEAGKAYNNDVISTVWEKLTHRQRQAIKYRAKGYQYVTIARRMGITPQGARKHAEAARAVAQKLYPCRKVYAEAEGVEGWIIQPRTVIKNIDGIRQPITVDTHYLALFKDTAAAAGKVAEEHAQPGYIDRLLADYKPSTRLTDKQIGALQAAAKREAAAGMPSRIDYTASRAYLDAAAAAKRDAIRREALRQTQAAAKREAAEAAAKREAAEARIAAKQEIFNNYLSSLTARQIKEMKSTPGAYYAAYQKITA
jgi:hypothetical protein